MRLATAFRAGVVAVGALVALTGSAGAFSLRVPQVAFATAALQAHLNAIDGGINAATDQIDGQTFSTGFTGNTAFSMTMKTAAGTAIGVYNTTAVTPTLYQCFPPTATAGYSVSCRFELSGALTVRLYNASAVLLSTTSYTGVDRTHFGFYIQGPNGTWYSQDGRNGGNAQILTYLGTGANYGNWVECFEDAAYASGSSTFTGAVLMCQSVNPTPVRSSTWGMLKAMYQ